MFLGFREPLKLLQIVLFVWVVWVLVGFLCVFVLFSLALHMLLLTGASRLLSSAALFWQISLTEVEKV